ncbi:MAG TPA: YhcH/YjgK/YiaL family protein [Gammaproteobacteria bacterium]
MILDSLANADRYTALHPLFARAFDYLRTTHLESIESGRFNLDGDNLIAIFSKGPGKERANAKLECHRRYIDIQYIISGTDEMGWKSLRDCMQPVNEFNEEKDIQFFSDNVDSWVNTPTGSFCIFFPDDAHAPLVSNREIHKVVMKIAVDPA